MVTDFDKNDNALGSVVEDFMKTVVNLKEYPYLLLCITIVVIQGPCELPFLMNAAIEACKDAGIQMLYDAYAGLYEAEGLKFELAVVKQTDLILFYRCSGMHSAA